MSLLVYKVENKRFVLREIDKLKTLGYNRFMWWRRFTPSSPPLDSKSSLLDKIRNGDLDFSHYWWQAKYTEIELNEKLQESLDYNHWVQTTQVDRNRRKRLYEDFDKDETTKLAYIKKEFLKEFYMSLEDYEEEISSFDGSLEELYLQCVVIYGKKLRIQSKRGRPKK